MRRSTSALTTMILGAAASVSTVSAQQSLPSATATARRAAQAAPASAANPSQTADDADPGFGMAAARGARYLLHNGLDYIGYQEYERALRYLREAEKRQGELSNADKVKLTQAIERAQRGLRESVGTERAYARSDRGRRPTGLVAAAPAAAASSTARTSARRREGDDRGEPIRLAGAELPAEADAPADRQRALADARAGLPPIPGAPAPLPEVPRPPATPAPELADDRAQGAASPPLDLADAPEVTPIDMGAATARTTPRRPPAAPVEPLEAASFGAGAAVAMPDLVAAESSVRAPASIADAATRSASASVAAAATAAAPAPALPALDPLPPPVPAEPVVLAPHDPIGTPAPAPALEPIADLPPPVPAEPIQLASRDEPLTTAPAPAPAPEPVADPAPAQPMTLERPDAATPDAATPPLPPPPPALDLEPLALPPLGRSAATEPAATAPPVDEAPAPRTAALPDVELDLPALPDELRDRAAAPPLPEEADDLPPLPGAGPAGAPVDEPRVVAPPSRSSSATPAEPTAAMAPAPVELPLETSAVAVPDPVVDPIQEAPVAEAVPAPTPVPVELPLETSAAPTVDPAQEAPVAEAPSIVAEEPPAPEAVPADPPAELPPPASPPASSPAPMRSASASAPASSPAESFLPSRTNGASTLSPELQNQVDALAQRQEEEYRVAQSQPAAAPAQPPAADASYDPSSDLRSQTQIDISRAPSPAESRPIRAIPVPEDWVPMGARNWSAQRKYWSAAATCHMPLYFQDPMLERYGHSVERFVGPLGRFMAYPVDHHTETTQRNQIAQPFASIGLFAGQILALPYNLIMDPPWEAQYDLGYWRPGDKIPTDLYWLPTHGTGPPLKGKNY